MRRGGRSHRNLAVRATTPAALSAQRPLLCKEGIEPLIPASEGSRHSPTFYLKRISRSNRIRRMPRSRDSWVFALTLMAAAAVLVSIAVAETLLAMACLAWMVTGPRPIVWPSYLVPMAAFMVSTVVALLMSPQPEHRRQLCTKIRSFCPGTAGRQPGDDVLTRQDFGDRPFDRGVRRLGICAGPIRGGLCAFSVDFHLGYDPMVLARIKGFMGHWMTFSGEQLLVWCAALPAMLALKRRWLLPLGIVGTALVLSFTRSVWLGAIGAFIVAGLLMPRSPARRGCADRDRRGGGFRVDLPSLVAELPGTAICSGFGYALSYSLAGFA